MTANIGGELNSDENMGRQMTRTPIHEGLCLPTCQARRKKLRRAKGKILPRGQRTPNLQIDLIWQLLGAYEDPQNAAKKISPLAYEHIAGLVGVSPATVGKEAYALGISAPPKQGVGRKKGSKDKIARVRWSPHRQDVFRLKKEHPNWTNADIGRELGITKEAVRQLFLEPITDANKAS